MVVSRSIPGGHDGRVKFEAQVGKYGRKVLSETETEWAKAGSNDSSIHGWKQGWLGWLAAWLVAMAELRSADHLDGLTDD